MCSPRRTMANQTGKYHCDRVNYLNYLNCMGRSEYQGNWVCRHPLKLLHAAYILIGLTQGVPRAHSLPRQLQSSYRIRQDDVPFLNLPR